MDIPLVDLNATGHWVDDPVQKKFFENSKFCLYLQEYVRKLLSIEIVIMLQRPASVEEWEYTDDSATGYMIQLLDKTKNKTEMKQTLTDFCNNLFNRIQSKTFKDEKVEQCLLYSPAKDENLQCIQNIMNEKISDAFTACQIVQKSLKIYYLGKEPSSVYDSKHIDHIIEKNICQETILLPLIREQSSQFQNELERLRTETGANNQVYFHFISSNSSFAKRQQKILIFGYYKLINQFKKQLEKIIERFRLITFKLDSIDALQSMFIRRTCQTELYELEQKYEDVGLHLRLTLNEFIAPQHLKDEIESYLINLISKSTITKTTKSIQLSKDVAEKAQKYLEYIAQKNYCSLKIELTHKFRSYMIPKSSISTKQISKSFIDQSNQFCSSSDIFNRIIIANGSIEIRTGDITQLKVDTIVILNTPDGLKEGVIERAGVFSSEHTYIDTNGIKFTETNGGNLNCKRILFSNWTPIVISNDDNQLRKSIQLFISKSIEYAIKDKNCSSIAFAVSDSSTNELILAQEMINEAKRQLESTNLQLKILFILLSEQQTLLNQFFYVISPMQNIYAQFDWPTAVIRTTLVASDEDQITKCQEKLHNYLRRCATSLKITNSNGIFQYWDQYTINTFYKYSKDKCVLIQIDKTTNEMELIGPINNIHQIKRKYYFLSELAKEKTSRVPTIERPSSAAIRSARVEAKVYNIMISYSQQDSRLCQRLINRLIEEGFSIWAEPVINEQQRNVHSQIDKSDCIILCVSQNYYESQSCEKEARYAYQTGKQVLLIKIQNDPLIGWQRELFENKLFFQLFGSEDHFHLEFDNLLINILQLTKPGYVSLLQQRSTRTQQDHETFQTMLTIEQRQKIYDKKITTLMNIGRIEDEEMTTLIEQLNNILNNNYDENDNASDEQNETNNEPSIHFSADTSDWINRWLKKPTNITKQNLPPFSPTGDINDAPFPMPDFIAQFLNRHVPAFSSSNLRSVFESDIFIRPIELPFIRVLFNPIPVDDQLTCGKSTQKVRLTDGYHYSTDDSNPRKTNRLPLLPLEMIPSFTEKSDNTDKVRDLNENVEEDFVKKDYSSPTKEMLKIYQEKFAQRMNENHIQFQLFCSKYAN